MGYEPTKIREREFFREIPPLVAEPPDEKGQLYIEDECAPSPQPIAEHYANIRKPKNG
jgi:hypothetical protein